MGIAAFLIYEKKDKSSISMNALGYFAIQLILNAIWSIVFFGLHEIFLGLLIIILLWLFILVCIIKFFMVSKPAGWLLVPYLLWVSFAVLLNATVWKLN